LPRYSVVLNKAIKRRKVEIAVKVSLIVINEYL